VTLARPSALVLRAIGDPPLRVERLDEPPGVVRVGVADAVEHELARPLGLEEPGGAAGQLDDGAPYTEAEERLEQVLDHASEGSFPEAGPVPEPEDEDLLEAEMRSAGDEQDLTELARQEARSSEAAQLARQTPVEEARDAAHRTLVMEDGAREELRAARVESTQVRGDEV
jgi:hypothetical protein